MSKKKKNFKEKRAEFKEMMKNPRKKALFQLGCWGAFFLISYLVIILIPHPTPVYRNPNSNTKKDTLTNYQTMNNFEYTYTFSYNGKEEEIVGTYFDNHYYFSYLNQEYYTDEENIYEVDSTNKMFKNVDNFIVLLSLTELRKENLAEFLVNDNLVESKEYKDGKKINTYQYFIEENKYIYLTVTEQDRYIEEILVDLKDYLESKELIFSNFEVKLQYSEINNLSSYSKNYSDYVLEGV